MPGMYKPGEYDVAGFAVGVVEHDDIIPKHAEMEVGTRIFFQQSPTTFKEFMFDIHLFLQAVLMIG